MLDSEPDTMSTTAQPAASTTAQPAAPPRRRRAASRPAGPPQAKTSSDQPAGSGGEGAERVRNDAPTQAAADGPSTEAAASQAPARARRTRRVAAEPAAPAPGNAPDAPPDSPQELGSSSSAGAATAAPAPVAAAPALGADATANFGAPGVLFQAPAVPAPAPRRAAAPAATEAAAPATGAPGTGSDEEPGSTPPARRRSRGRSAGRDGDQDSSPEPQNGSPTAGLDPEERAEPADPEDEDDDEASAESDGRRRRRRGGRRRKRRADGEPDDAVTDSDLGADDPDRDTGDGQGTPDADAAATPDDDEVDSRRRRRRRRRTTAGDLEPSPDDPPNTVIKVRAPRTRGQLDPAGDETSRGEVRALRGSTRLEAKKQRRREGRDQGRRRVPVVTESEFLARRESVERVMVVRQAGDRTQIAVLEDGMLVEHYINRASSTSFVGNVYLGRVQNVLSGMEAAFVDIGKGRNGVLYAGEVNWDAAGLEGQPRRIESALKAGEPVLVQVTKDPMGHKGARLTSQISLPGRFLVYVPDGSMTGISRKLPDTERGRLKSILRGVVPEDAGVIVRTAAEGASEEELASDVARLRAQAEDIAEKAKNAASAPALLYGEPDLTVRVIRDVFNEDFASLIVSGDEAWDTVQGYVGHVAPDLVGRLSRWSGDQDVFASYRVDEQLTKALDRKVFLPSGGSLVIDRTEAMVVIDVNTGKFIGKGGNLEETVTKNNLEAAEEIVRQLRLRDLGGIIVMDFIDMVLESNRDLVLRRLLECLGRDRTKHQVAEVTSLGLVQMTRKRVGQGLLEAFSETCEHCNGRGVRISMTPVPVAVGDDSSVRPAAPASPGRSQRRRDSEATPGRVPLPGPGLAGPLGAPGDPSDGGRHELSTELLDEPVYEPVHAQLDEPVAEASDEPVDARPEEPVAEASEEPAAEPVRPRRRRATRTVATPAPVSLSEQVSLPGPEHIAEHAEAPAPSGADLPVG